MSNRTVAMLKIVNHLDLGYVNDTLTSLSNRGRVLWNSPRATLIRIEVLVVLAAFSLLFLAIFGSWRRRSRNSVFQNCVLISYTLSSSLVNYTLGSTQSSVVKSTMYAIWAISLYVLFGCADSITAYSLDDNNQINRQIYQCLLYYFYVALISSTVTRGGVAFAPIGYLAIISLLKFIERLGACLMASASWNLNKMVGDYMYQEHTKSELPYDPVTIEGYHYLVDWPLESKLKASTSYESVLIAREAAVVDIEKVWHCENLSTELYFSPWLQPA